MHDSGIFLDPMSRHFVVLLCLLWAAAPLLADEARPNDADKAPARIVSLAPSITETLFALGAGHLLVGATTFCDYPPQAQKIPRVGSFMNPSIEAILARKPDLVIGIPERLDRQRAARIEQLGLNFLSVKISTVNELFETISLLAKVVRKESAAKALLKSLRTQIADVKDQVSGAARRRVLVIVGYQPLIAAGAGGYIDDLISLAGGVNVAASAQQPWPVLSMEFVVAQAPEVIIEAGMGSERKTKETRWQDLGSLPAVRQARVHTYPSDKILRPGPRVGQALEELARLIHPECFTGGTKRKAACEGS
jgi:iron complex transport system substrate-binding protein